MNQFGSETPSLAIIVIMIGTVLIGASTWRNARGEGWGLAVFMGSLLLGFNLSVTFAVWTLEGLAGLFGGMGSWVDSATDLGSGFGLVAVMVVLFGTAYIMNKVKFDLVRIAALGTLYGILIRLFTDFLFWLYYSGVI
jgi:hypothetical protein